MSSKTKRQRKNKKFKFTVNRKRLRRKQTKTGIAGNAVPIVKHAWEDQKTIRDNLTSMGLSYDANVTLKIPSAKEMLKPLISESHADTAEAETSDPAVLAAPSKAHIADELEANANALRERKFELPSGQVLFLTYLIDKHGYDYKAMERDNRNIYQETRKQLRNKIRTFQKIPSQWNAYLASRPETETEKS